MLGQERMRPCGNNPVGIAPFKLGQRLRLRYSPEQLPREPADNRHAESGQHVRRVYRPPEILQKIMYYEQRLYSALHVRSFRIL